jgi:hypothetical protein
LITDDEAEKAADYLRDSARTAARAAANSEYLSEYRKVIKAQIMREHDNLPLGAQEREAYADSRYESHLKIARDAMEEAEYHKWMMKAADTKISTWQTQSRNARV